MLAGLRVLLTRDEFCKDSFMIVDKAKYEEYMTSQAHALAHMRVVNGQSKGQTEAFNSLLINSPGFDLFGKERPLPLPTDVTAIERQHDDSMTHEDTAVKGLDAPGCRTPLIGAGGVLCTIFTLESLYEELVFGNSCIDKETTRVFVRVARDSPAGVSPPVAPAGAASAAAGAPDAGSEPAAPTPAEAGPRAGPSACADGAHCGSQAGQLAHGTSAKCATRQCMPFAGRIPSKIAPGTRTSP